MPTIQFPHIAATYSEYLDRLYSYARHLGFDDHTSMDAIHDVFYKLCTHHSSLDEIDNLKFYLFRSLRNRLIDLKRTNREFPGFSSTEEVMDEYLPFQLNVTVEDELIMKEESEEIRQKVESVLNRLTQRQREIIYLRYIQECSYEEISDIMQISIAASRNLVSKSVTKLKESSLSLTLLLLMIK
ncbi:MAG: sigma-70 family RNA polymerase sigma factor [Proteiniphilum sp.]